MGSRRLHVIISRLDTKGEEPLVFFLYFSIVIYSTIFSTQQMCALIMMYGSTVTQIKLAIIVVVDFVVTPTVLSKELLSQGCYYL